MKRESAGPSSKLGRIMEAPLRALCRARDFYVSSMTGLAGRASGRGVVGCRGGAPGSHCFQQQKAGSSGGGEDDLRELVRAAASRGTAGSLRLRRSRGVGPKGQAVGIGRIDEDEPCDLDGDAMVGLDHVSEEHMDCRIE